jgi:hypothetical protein
VLSTEKVGVWNLALAFLCMGFLEGNLALFLLTTRGLLRPSGSGICSSKISLTSQVKKKEILQFGAAEI